MKKKRSRGIAAALVGCGLLFLGFLCYYSARWYLSLYGSLDFNAILFTLLSGLGGLEQSILVNFFRQPLSLGYRKRGDTTNHLQSTGKIIV